MEFTNHLQPSEESEKSDGRRRLPRLGRRCPADDGAEHERHHEHLHEPDEPLAHQVEHAADQNVVAHGAGGHRIVQHRTARKPQHERQKNLAREAGRPAR